MGCGLREGAEMTGTKDERNAGAGPRSRHGEAGVGARGDDGAVDRFLPLTPMAFEILLAVTEGARHGYDVMLEIERRTDGRLRPNPGTLYRALDRLVRQGLLRTTEGEGGSEPARYFHLAPLGRRVAAAEAARLRAQVGAAMAAGLIEDRGGPS